MKVLITGAAGFIGSHMVEHFLKNTDWDIVVLDRLTYASSGMDRLRDIEAFESKRVQLYPVDISYPITIGVEKEIGSVDYILHLAAETHVDNSISDPRPFVMTNVVGTMELLQFSRRMNGRIKGFYYFSTDEVFGPAYAQAEFKEWDRYNSTNPYSATKAAGEELCLAWANTYGIPMVITHCMNAFGERQHSEKFIPMVVKKILRGEMIQIHADPQRKNAGSRSYIHCRNIAAAVLFLIQKIEAPVGVKVREKYNIQGEREVNNLDLVQLIHKYMQDELKTTFALHYELVDFHSTRPGHDLRYALSGQKMKSLGWHLPNTFEDSLRKCISWMVNPRHLHWLMMD